MGPEQKTEGKHAPLTQGRLFPLPPAEPLDLVQISLPPRPLNAPTAASFDTEHTPGAAQRHERAQSAQRKRSATTAKALAFRLARDGLIARLWHGASLGDEKVAPAVREHFGSCVQACLENEAIKHHLAERLPGWSEASLRSHPIVRVEFEHAFVLEGLGESLGVARRKAWGDFLGIRPLDLRDPIDPMHVVYAFKPSSPYQRRFEQRQHLRRMLGKGYAPLVTRAFRSRKGEFRAELTEDEAGRIRARARMEPERFWRAAKGRELLEWPKTLRQGMLFDDGGP